MKYKTHEQKSKEYKQRMEEQYKEEIRQSSLTEEQRIIEEQDQINKIHIHNNLQNF